jgi:hypothetical protein
MIYLTPDELTSYYGRAFQGAGIPMFNEDRYKTHADNAWKYRFGLLSGRCIYSIVVKTSGGQITLAEAASLRALNGKGVWSYVTNLRPDNDSAAIEKLFNDQLVDLTWSYSPVAADQYQHQLFCSHQASRRQLVIWHPKWRVDLAEVSRMTF